MFLRSFSTLTACDLWTQQNPGTRKLGKGETITFPKRRVLFVTREHTALHPFSALPQQEPFFSCSELQQLLGHSHSLQGSSASDGCAQLHRRRVSSLFQNLRALFPCSYLVRFSSESHGSDQNILPTLSAFSLLDKCHVQSYLENLLGCI